MVKRAKNEINKTLSLRIVNPNTASIDIVATEIQVCVPTNRDSENNRRFGCFTKDLHKISSHLNACSINTLTMKSTEIYGFHSSCCSRKMASMSFLSNLRDIKVYIPFYSLENYSSGNVTFIFL